MNSRAAMLLSAVVMVLPLYGAAKADCGAVAAEARVDLRREALTLADLLGHESCPQLLHAATQMSLGTAPRAGALRVFDGREIRARIASLASGLGQPAVAIKTPERIVVQRGAIMKSCAEIGGYLSGESSLQLPSFPGDWQAHLDCSGADAIPGDAAVELTKTAWSAGLQRWELAMRCAQREVCGHFLVTVPGQSRAAFQSGGSSGTKSGPLFSDAPAAAPRPPSAESGGRVLLVKRGQTATLSWEQAGIRVVLPVTCLEAGALGQSVRVRLLNSPRILRAEVLGDGTLRVSL